MKNKIKIFSPLFFFPLTYIAGIAITEIFIVFFLQYFYFLVTTKKNLMIKNTISPLIIFIVCGLNAILKYPVN